MTEVPKNIYVNFPMDHSYRTRQASSGGIRTTADTFSESTFQYQARKYYNMIPGEFRQFKKDKFKKEMKKCVRENIPIR